MIRGLYSRSYRFVSEPDTPTLLHLATQHLRAELARILLYLGCNKANGSDNGLTAQEDDFGNCIKLQRALLEPENNYNRATISFGVSSAGEIEPALLLEKLDEFITHFRTQEGWASSSPCGSAARELPFGSPVLSAASVERSLTEVQGSSAEDERNLRAEYHLDFIGQQDSSEYDGYPVE